MDLDKFIDLVDVENNFAFLPRDGLTFCNCYAKVVLASQGIYIPNMKVNNIVDWLESENGKTWTKTHQGIAMIATAKRDPHGHIAVRLSNGKFTWAGSSNRKRGSLSASFGNIEDVVFWRTL